MTTISASARRIAAVVDAAWLACWLFALLGGAAAAQEAPFPAGTSSHELHGLRCSIVMPEDFDTSKEHSLAVILHGAGGTETGMASALAFLAKRDFVVLAPKSRAATWTKRDTDDVCTIVAELQERLHIGAGRSHAAGFSNGGWNLAPVAFAEDLRFASACWIAAGYKGGKPPKHAKKGMGVLALAGATDGNRNAAESTPKLLGDSVRSAEVRIEPGIGHEWPRGQMDYYGWWLGVQEGRFVPGETLAFEWQEWSPDTKVTSGFVYWYSAAPGEDEVARQFQNVTLQDARVRYYGGQLGAWKADARAHPEAFAAAKLKGAPAVVVFDAKGKPKKTLQGKISAKSLASALRSVAPRKKMPD